MDVPEEDDVQISKRQAIQAIMKDTSLLPQEKQQKIQEFMAGGAKTEESTKAAGCIPLSRQDDSSSSMETKQMKVVSTMSGSNVSDSTPQPPYAAPRATSEHVGSEASAGVPRSNLASISPPRSPMHPGGDECPSRQELVREIMNNISLTTQEKQQKVRDMMASASAAAPSHPSTARISRRSMQMPFAPLSAGAGSVRRSFQVPSSPLVGASSASGSAADPAARKMARQLAAASARLSLQVPMQSPTRSREASLPPAPALEDAENEDNSEGLKPKSRQDLVRAIMQDSSLAAQEKQQKVRDIMSSGTPSTPTGPSARRSLNMQSAPMSAPSARRSLQVPSSPLVGAAAVSTGAIDPAARKMARASARGSISSPLVSPEGRKSVGHRFSLQAPMQALPGGDVRKSLESVPHAPPLDNSEELEPKSRQDLIREVMKDSSLTAQEKQQKVRDIMSSGAPSTPTGPSTRRSLKMESAPTSAPSTRRSLHVPFSPLVGAAAVSTGAIDPAARKMAREASRSSPLLSPGGKKSVQSSMQSPGSATARTPLQAPMQSPGAARRSLIPPAPPIMEEEDGEEDSPKLSRQDMVKQIMSDSSLSTQEKQAKVRDVMSQKPSVDANSNATLHNSRSSLQIPPMSPLQEDVQAKLGDGEDIQDGLISDEASFGSKRNSNAQVGAALVGAAAVGAASAPSIDPATRKLQRESSRNQTSGSNQSRRSLNVSGHGSVGSSKSLLRNSNHGQRAPAPDAMRQSMIQSVRQDRELTEEEKEEQIHEIVSGNAGMGVVSTESYQLSSRHPTANSELEVDDESAKPEMDENGEEPEVVIDADEGGGATSQVPAEVAAFVANQDFARNAVIPTDVVTTDDIEEEEDLRKRRFLWAGCCCFCMLIIAIVVPLVALAPEKDSVIVLEQEPSAAPSLFPTQAPSAPPTPGAVLELLLELEALYPSYDDYLQAFNSSETIQYKALYWATSEGNQGGLSGFDPRMISRFALATFYFATNGDGWVRCQRDGTNCDPGAEWLLADDECGWLAIACADGTTDVTQIFFPPTGQAGENNVAGTLPFELSFLTDLTRITISRNNIGGSIPAWTDLTKLEAVILSENQLTGELPSSLINNNQNLRQIRLQGNQISQLPQDPIRSSGLTLLDLQNNALSGPIPEGIQGLSALQTLDLRGNSLNSTVPEGLFQIDSLRNLYLADNALSGNISASFELLTSIRRMELAGNNLTGEIPAGLCAFKTDPGDLSFLTADCDKVICACCDNDCSA